MTAAQIQPGETILIIGAGGAVGQAATQIANWKQARVIGAAMRCDPIPGAEAVIDTDKEVLRERALGSLTPGGRQAAISSAGNSRQLQPGRFL